MRLSAARLSISALTALLACSGDLVGGSGSGPDDARDGGGKGDGPGGSGNTDAGTDAETDAGPDWVAEPLMIGIASGHPDFMDHPDIDRFFESQAGERHFRMGHMYVPWNVALEDSDRRQELIAWLAKAAEHGIEPSIAFNPERLANGDFDTYRPSVDEFQAAFDAFRTTWPEVVTFLAWNEPNATVTRVEPERAADYYLMMAARCGNDCRVGAGNFRGWFDADTDALRMGPGGPDNPTCGSSGSYFDRYKCRLGDHRPTIWAFHPYLDGYNYRERSWHCSDANSCQTKLFMASLAGSWSASEVWMTETGARYANPNLAASEFKQACTGAFFLRLFSLPAFAGRVTRFYYFNWYGYTDDLGIVDKTAAHAPRAIFNQLRDRVTQYDPSCP